MELKIHTPEQDYSIVLEHGILEHAKDWIGTAQKVFLISDDGVPKQYQESILRQYPDAHSFIFPQGEASKSMETWSMALKAMLDAHLSRKDLVIALGGGVVGDLSGFTASTYMRGIRYVNIPTTVLSQIDSSIGGKTAIDMHGVKNCVGAFHQPSLVLIDPDTLKTLPARQISNGLAEAIKEGMIKDPTLFEIFESEDVMSHLDEIIERCLIIKRDIVEEDEKESGVRKLLNFGHTYGHGFESSLAGAYYHGECVAMGMMQILQNQELKQRLAAILQRLQLPTSTSYDAEEVMEKIRNDKKSDHDSITIVQVDELGKGYTEEWTMDQIRKGLNHE